MRGSEEKGQDAFSRFCYLHLSTEIVTNTDGGHSSPDLLS